MKGVWGRIFLLVVAFSLVQGIKAQVSVKMGYDIGFIQKEPQNIFAHYRSKHTFLAFADKKVTNLQGVLFGIRYKNDHVATELDFNYGFWTAQGSGVNKADKREEVKASLVNSSIGYSLEGLFYNFGLGTSIHYNQFSQKVKNSITGNVKDKSSYLSQKVFLGIYIPGSKHTTLAFRPYITFPFGNINFYFMEQALNGDRPQLMQRDFDYKPSAFGIQFLFLNGG